MNTITKKPLNTTEIYKELSNKTGLDKSQVKKTIEALKEMISENLSNREVGQFTIPGTVKFKTVIKEAVPERRGINPFTKEETTFKAKPAKIVVKASVLKALKNLSLD